MADLVNTGNKNTLLDNNLVVSSESVLATRVFVADSVNNRVGVNKAIPAVDLDIVGSVAITSTLTVQTNRLIVDSLGRVAINTTTSANQLEVAGDVSINGTLTVSGTFIRFDATSLEINDPNILLNKNGNDASASGAGLTIQRTVTNAALSWNNTKLNFEAGLTTGLTSLIRAGGNTDAAALTIGTSDNFGFNLRTNGTDRVLISTTGNVSIANNQTVSVTGTLSNQSIAIKDSLVPPGSIVAIMPGYYTDGVNGGFTATLGGNTIALLNSWLLTNGYSQWAVCNGDPYNIPSSLIFNGPSRFTPNLTDERFTHGNNSIDAVGGTNSGSHTHPVPNALTGVDVSHTHTTTTDSAGLTPGAGTSGATSPGSTQSASSTSTGYVDQGSSPVTVNLDHSHGGSYSHFHSAGVVPGSAPNGNLVIQFGVNPGVPSGAFAEARETPVSSWTPDIWIYNSPTSAVKTAGGVNSRPVFMSGDSTSTSATLGGTSPSLTSFSLDHTHSVPSHTHTLQAHTHTVTTHNHSGGPHSHSTASPGTTTWSAGGAVNTQFSHTHTIAQVGGTENRPLYLSCFYIMRIT